MRTSSLLKNRLTWIFVAIILAGVAIYLSRDVWGGNKAPDYQTAEVTRGDLELSISSAGKVVPKETVTVGAQVSGQLIELLVEAGDLVEAGQLLARIDATIAETSVEGNRAQLRELQASRKQQEATLALSKANAERAAMLYDNDAISRVEYESAQADYTVATGRLDAIEAQIERQTSTLRAQQATLEFTNIYAPISGTVVSIEAVKGQTLNANQTAPTILTLADLTAMTVETDVSEADVLRIKPGQKAWFNTLGDASSRWETKVRQILPTPEVLNDVVLYKAILDIANPDNLLKPEMTAQVFFVLGEAKDAVIVPVAALQSRPPRLAGNPRPGAEGASGPRQGRPGGLMQAEASERVHNQGDDPSRAAFMQARQAHPDAEVATVRIVGVNGEIEVRPVLIGLKTRTQAEVIYGLEPGQVVVTGEGGVAPMGAIGPQGPQGPRGPMGGPR